MSTVDSALQRSRGRRQMLLILAICAAPFVLGTLAYYFYRPDGRTNYGELIEPKPLALRGERLDGAPFTLERLAGKWVLITIDSPACAGGCEAKLFATRQLRTAQGRDQDAVDRLWLLTGPEAPAAKLDPLIAERDRRAPSGRGVDRGALRPPTRAAYLSRRPAGQFDDALSGRDRSRSRSSRICRSCLRVNSRGR